MDASVQLNVRMPRSLRDGGNSALESKGLAPSEFVRSVWEILAKRGEALESLLSVITASQDVSKRTEDNPLTRGQFLYAQALESMGVSSLSAVPEARPYKSMVEEAIVDRWVERGLIDG